MGRGGWALSLGCWLLPVLLLLTAAYYLWPLRIFIHYLRENNKAQFKAYFILWRWKIPLKTGTPAGRGKGLDRHWFRKVIKKSRPYRKRLVWKKFSLAIDWGLEDPALTGMATGGGWALLGALLPLLLQHFQFEAKPKIKINPAFDGAAFKVNWEGEIVAPLSVWLKLQSLLK